MSVMPACPIDLHDDEVLGEGLADLLEEEIHHSGRRLGQNQRDHLSSCRSHSRVSIHVFSYHLCWGMGAYTWRSPTALGSADAAKTTFILGHDQHRALIFGWSRGDCRLSLRFKVFLKCC